MTDKPTRALNMHLATIQEDLTVCSSAHVKLPLMRPPPCVSSRRQLEASALFLQMISHFMNGASMAERRGHLVLTDALCTTPTTVRRTVRALVDTRKHTTDIIQSFWTSEQHRIITCKQASITCTHAIQCT